MRYFTVVTSVLVGLSLVAGGNTDLSEPEHPEALGEQEDDQHLGILAILLNLMHTLMQTRILSKKLDKRVGVLEDMHHIHEVEPSPKTTTAFITTAPQPITTTPTEPATTTPTMWTTNSLRVNSTPKSTIWATTGPIRTTNPYPKTTNPYRKTTNPYLKTTNPYLKTTNPYLKTTNPFLRVISTTFRTAGPVRTTNPYRRTTNPYLMSTLPATTTASTTSETTPSTTKPTPTPQTTPEDADSQVELYEQGDEPDLDVRVAQIPYLMYRVMELTAENQRLQHRVKVLEDMHGE